MSYEKQSWQTGETITAQKLNHMEDGIGDNSENNNWLTVNIVKDNPEEDTMRLDKTAGQIIAAYPYVLIYAAGAEDNIMRYSIGFIENYIYNPDSEVRVYDFSALKLQWGCNLLSEYPTLVTFT